MHERLAKDLLQLLVTHQVQRQLRAAMHLAQAPLRLVFPVVLSAMRPRATERSLATRGGALKGQGSGGLQARSRTASLKSKHEAK